MLVCSGIGLVDEGCRLVDFIEQVYGITLTIEHCVCMGDLLGHGGKLNEAEDLIYIYIFLNQTIWYGGPS